MLSKNKILLSVVGFVLLSASTPSFGMDIFEKAIVEGDVETVKAFVSDESYDINKFGDKGSFYKNWTPLFIACADYSNGEHPEIIRELLKSKKIDVNKQTKYGQTPLITACRQGSLDIVKELLKHKEIDVDKMNKEGETPLFCACTIGLFKQGSPEVVEALLLHGARIDKELFDLPVLNALPLVRPKINRRLELALECDKLKQTGEDLTYFIESNKQDPELYEFAKQLGAERPAKKPSRFFIELKKHIVDGGKYKKYRDCVIKIMDIPAYPIRKAIKKGDLSGVKRFIEKENIDINATLMGPLSLLDWACMCNQLDIVNFMLQYCTKKTINKETHEESLFGVACDRGNIKMAKLLLEHGIDHLYLSSSQERATKPEILKYLELTCEYDKIQKVQDKIQFIFDRKQCGDVFVFLVKRAFSMSLNELQKKKNKSKSIESVFEPTVFYELYKKLDSDDLEKIFGVCHRCNIYEFIGTAAKVNYYYLGKDFKNLAQKGFGEKIKKSKFRDCVVNCE